MVQPLVPSPAASRVPLSAEPPPAPPRGRTPREPEPADLARFAANVREAVRRARVAEAQGIGPSPAEVDDERGVRVRRFFARFTLAIARPDAPAMSVDLPFRMAQGPSETTARGASLRAALGGSPAARHVGWIVAGRASPEMLRDVAQALADVHPAEASSPGRFRDFLARLGVGIDCAGSVQQALYASRGLLVAPEKGALGLRPRLLENLGALESRAAFARVARPAEARPGDVITLEPPFDGEPGHTVIVAERRVRQATIADAALGGNAFAIAAGDQLVELDVDSSWGGRGPGERTWIYDERTERWGEVVRHGGAQTLVPSSKSGPYDHELHGIFRARE